jgi:hypothetical protein
LFQGERLAAVGFGFARSCMVVLLRFRGDQHVSCCSKAIETTSASGPIRSLAKGQFGRVCPTGDV